jgi:trk system potassium uptake protein TrkA
MKVIIMGGRGRVSHRRHPLHEKQDVILVDRNEERRNELAETLDVMTLHGSGSSPEVLKKAGLAEPTWSLPSRQRRDQYGGVLLASTQSRVSFKIARIRNPRARRYLSVIFGKDHLNINLCINPEREASRTPWTSSSSPADGGDGFPRRRIKLIGFPVLSSAVTGRPSRNSARSIPTAKCSSRPYPRRDLIEPRGDSVIRENDYFFAVAAAEEAKELLRIFGRKTETGPADRHQGRGQHGADARRGLEGKGVASRSS